MPEDLDADMIRVGPAFTDNLRRLLGVHRLSAAEAGKLIGVTPATMSAWANRKSSPSLARAIAIAEFFQISTDRLMRAEFIELLSTELSDPIRYAEVENKINPRRLPPRARRVLQSRQVEASSEAPQADTQLAERPTEGE